MWCGHLCCNSRLASQLQCCISSVHINMVVDSSTVGHNAQMGRPASKLNFFSPEIEIVGQASPTLYLFPSKNGSKSSQLKVSSYLHYIQSFSRHSPIHKASETSFYYGIGRNIKLRERSGLILLLQMILTSLQTMPTVIG